MGRFCSATLACAIACGFDTGGVATGTGSVGASTSSEGGDTSPVTNPTASATDPDDSTSPTDPSATVDSTATDVDTTEGSTSVATSTSTASDEQGSTTGSSVPMVHHLTTTDQSACNEPLWCFTGSVWTEYGDPIYGQQCFTSPIAPPFELISVHYVVADVAPELTGFILEVHARDENGPTDILAFEQRPAADATAGSHDHVFETPIQIDDASFCVGFATPYEGLAAALGMAVDDGTAVGDASFIRLEGPTGCAIPLWTDVIDDLDPEPSGNWCIDVHIREIL